MYLEKEWKHWKHEKEISKKSLLEFYIKLIGGFLGGVLSLLWILHIILYVLPSKPITPFLNDVLIALQYPGVSFLGTAIYALFVLYLLWCVMKGNIKFGLRLLFFRVHPMKKDAT